MRRKNKEPQNPEISPFCHNHTVRLSHCLMIPVPKYLFPKSKMAPQFLCKRTMQVIVSRKGRVIAEALARSVSLPSKSVVCIEILCLLQWLDMSARDYGSKSPLLIHHHHCPTLLTKFLLSVTKGI